MSGSLDSKHRHDQRQGLQSQWYVQPDYKSFINRPHHFWNARGYLPRVLPTLGALAASVQIQIRENGREGDIGMFQYRYIVGSHISEARNHKTKRVYVPRHMRSEWTSSFTINNIITIITFFFFFFFLWIFPLGFFLYFYLAIFLFYFFFFSFCESTQTQ